MAVNSHSRASIPNPALIPLNVLVGTWTTSGHHPLIPDTSLHGRVTFEWIEGGAFLLMRSHNDDPRIPAGIAIIGSDDFSDDFTMIYFDERGVSRKYEMSLRDNQWQWWRVNEEFSQRFKGTISADGNTISTMGEMSKNGSTWEPDLALTYTRDSVTVNDK
ncbi:MAG: hypothetical protein U0528_14150 [Anaerolineae bacterium]|nr:hypothetical protein [Anaerolineae bacterium]